ncbi:MAG: hypothetical protein EZS28_016732 [Streblomastix strix]|uniref:Uncharacterized protein n=1 Tax=Streblomastix strix TaxID=222440 RepID=A0A5J4VZQ4_9EUKA|nr:MAG: hypothetical protein EZS28_016732 [Streblomastix strix]
MRLSKQCDRRLASKHFLYDALDFQLQDNNHFASYHKDFESEIVQRNFAALKDAESSLTYLQSQNDVSNDFCKVYRDKAIHFSKQLLLTITTLLLLHSLCRALVYYPLTSTETQGFIYKKKMDKNNMHLFLILAFLASQSTFDVTAADIYVSDTGNSDAGYECNINSKSCVSLIQTYPNELLSSTTGNVSIYLTGTFNHNFSLTLGRAVQELLSSNP